MIDSNFNNFHYSGVDVDYEHGRHDCKCGDDYCRCGTIENAHVKGVSVEAVIDYIISINKLQCSELEKYCLDRLARVHKVYNTDLWDVDVIGGYYGEEIGPVTFNAYSEMSKDMNEMLSFKSDKKKIDYSS